MTTLSTVAPAEIWSATPTPLRTDLSLDGASVERMVDHHVKLGVDGLMLGGTCGEGPWMPFVDLLELVRLSARAGRGRLALAVQVTDNSARQMLGHIERLAAVGAQYAVVASPYFLVNVTPRRLLNLYLEVIRKSPLPVGFYDRGRNAGHILDERLLEELLSEPNLKMVKDSSMDPARREVFLGAARLRHDLSVLNGDEFDCIEPLRAGYDGVLLGGGIFNARLVAGIATAVTEKKFDEAACIQKRMNELMFRVYGGPKITCWLTGLKYLMVRLGVFSETANYLDYPLTPECRSAIDEIVIGQDPDGYRRDLECGAGVGAS